MQLNDPFYAFRPQILSIAGGGALTTVSLEIPSEWAARLLSAPRLRRFMQIRISLTCEQKPGSGGGRQDLRQTSPQELLAELGQEPMPPLSPRRSIGNKWPHSVFLDARGSRTGGAAAWDDEDMLASTVAAGWDPNYNEAAFALRYEHDLATEPLDETVQLLVQPWMVAGWSTVIPNPPSAVATSAAADSSSAAAPRPAAFSFDSAHIAGRRAIKIYFRGSGWGNASGTSYVGIRAEVWERVVLPASFDPRQQRGLSSPYPGGQSYQPPHRCLNPDAGAAPNTGCAHGRHLEYMALDDSNIERADRLAAAAALASGVGAFEVTVAQQRAALTSETPRPNRTPRNFDDDEIRSLLAANAELKLQLAQQQQQQQQLSRQQSRQQSVRNSPVVSPRGTAPSSSKHFFPAAMTSSSSTTSLAPSPAVSTRHMQPLTFAPLTLTDAEVHAETLRRLNAVAPGGSSSGTATATSSASPSPPRKISPSNSPMPSLRKQVSVSSTSSRHKVVDLPSYSDDVALAAAADFLIAASSTTSSAAFPLSSPSRGGGGGGGGNPRSQIVIEPFDDQQQPQHYHIQMPTSPLPFSTPLPPQRQPLAPLVPKGRLAPLLIHTGAESNLSSPQASLRILRRPLPPPSATSSATATAVPAPASAAATPAQVNRIDPNDPFHAHYAPEIDHFTGAATPAAASMRGGGDGMQQQFFPQPSPRDSGDTLMMPLPRASPNAFVYPGFVATPGAQAQPFQEQR